MIFEILKIFRKIFAEILEKQTSRRTDSNERSSDLKTIKTIGHQRLNLFRCQNESDAIIEFYSPWFDDPMSLKEWESKYLVWEPHGPQVDLGFDVR